MQPTAKDVHQDTALSSLSIGYRTPMFIADQIFPTVRVANQTDKYYEWRKGAWFRNEAAMRAPGTMARRATMPLTTGTYKCEEYALGHMVPIERINNADAAIRPMEVAARFATRKVMLAKEVLASALITTAGTWGTDEDAEGAWVATADGSGNTFIADVEKAKDSIRNLIGINPNTLVMDAITFSNCKQEYTVLERIKYTGTQNNPAVVTANALAQLFELDRVLIGSALYSDAEEVVAGTDFNAVKLWETNASKGSAWVGYVEDQPALEMPSAGYTFNWPGDEAIEDLREVAEGGNPYRTIRYYWEKAAKSYVVECSEYFDLKATCASAGYLFTDTYAT